MKPQKEHPLIKDLKTRISECKIRLLEILEEWYVLQTEVQPKLLFTYESLFGSLESELRVKNQLAIELDRRVELLSIKLKSGEELTEKTIKFIENIVEREANRIKKIKRSGVKNKKFVVPKCSVNEKYELPRVYRKLVKKLHPDASGDESIEYKKFWDQIQNAYKNEDVERLNLYAQTLLEEEDTGIRDIHSERIKLNTEVHQLEVNINNAKKKIEMLRDQEPFCFEDKLNDNLWIARKRRNLREKIFHLDREILYKEKMLKSLTNGKYVAEKTETGSVRFVKKEYSSFAV
jgi:hypothetical protein